MNLLPPTGPRSAWRTAGIRWCLVACLPVLAAGPVPLGAVEAPAATVLHLGFSSDVFIGVNENDAKAALKVWAQTLAEEHGVMIVAESIVLNGRDAIASAVRDKRVDCVTLSAEEYSVLGGEFLAPNAVLGVNGGLVTEEYLVLVHRDSNITGIDGLRGRRLIFFHNARASLAPVWFEALLLQSGLGQTRRFCGRVIEGTKLAQVVLPVFFRQADACVVTRRGFQTMVELNPQVGRQLKILLTSPPMVPVVFLFRADYSDPIRDRIMAKVEGVRSSVAAQQVLTLFQCEGLQVYPISVLDSALELLAKHARLAQAASHAGSEGREIPHVPVKTGGP